MQQVLLLFFSFAFLANTISTEPCNSTYQCVDEFNYQVCNNDINGEAVVNGPFSCFMGQICNVKQTSLIPCLEDLVLGTTAAPELICNGAGKFSILLCSQQYYECEGFLFWWNAVLKTCPDGTTFVPVFNECSKSNIFCRNDTTPPFTITTPTPTTTLSPTTLAPTTLAPTTTTDTPSPPSISTTADDDIASTTLPCSHAVKYPSSWENKYYECKFVWFKWKLELVTCPQGEIFSDFLQKCVPTTTPPPGALPICTAPGKYAALQANQYYECKFAWLKWNLYLLTCPVGQIFNQTLESCVPAPDVPSNCTESAKYPGPQVNQYYQCKYGWLKNQLYLVTCPEEQIFNQTVDDCVPVPGIPPACSGPGNFPAILQNEYYECKYSWFKWKPSLQTCPLGKIFDQKYRDCVPVV